MSLKVSFIMILNPNLEIVLKINLKKSLNQNQLSQMRMIIAEQEIKQHIHLKLWHEMMKWLVKLLDSLRIIQIPPESSRNQQNLPETLNIHPDSFINLQNLHDYTQRIIY